MKQIVVVLLLFVVLSLSGFSQNSLNDYNYVLVPQQFEFQREVDQYQINTLVRYLFKEAGFNSIYQVESKGLPKCEGLFADLILDSRFLSTSITVVLKDCNNNTVYLSEPGISKEKDYRKAYHEAIRRAFKSINILGVSQGNLEAFRESVHQRNTALVNLQASDLNQETISVDQIIENKIPEYSHNGLTFYLGTTDDGYLLYERQQEKIVNIGTLSKTSRIGLYLFTSKGKISLASFDDKNNLIIDAEDNDGTPSQNVFIKVNQE